MTIWMIIDARRVIRTRANGTPNNLNQPCKVNTMKENTQREQHHRERERENKILLLIHQIISINA